MTVSQDRGAAPRLAVAGLARLVLALATGLPLCSAGRLIPDPERADGPYLGI